VISLVIFHYLPLHFSATMILGGEGTFKQMVHKLTLLQTRHDWTARSDEVRSGAAQNPGHPAPGRR
ncbi:hypothetical protein Q6280_28000, partial [Klebsiella pneumoniae]|uniref:hypothetical protein n=1 Tax=Klebsiella pneumoniae TaxID=573 RepID=UPI0027320AF6